MKEKSGKGDSRKIRELGCMLFSFFLTFFYFILFFNTNNWIGLTNLLKVIELRSIDY